LNERLLSHHLGGDLLNLGSELPLSGLVSLGLGSALGYRDFGLLQPGGRLPQRERGREGGYLWGSGGREGASLLKGLSMFADLPIQASLTGAAPGVCVIIAVSLNGKGEPGSIREADNLGKIFLQAQELS